MGLLNGAFVCLLIIIPLANSELNSRKLPRDVNLISGKITSFTGAGQHDLRANIPGEPGVDYPIYSSPPDTSFSCFNRHEGYYADVETRCQVFRICSHTDHTGKGFAFLCPNGTLFSQNDFVCDWYKNVPCESSPNYYFMNELLDKSVSPQPDVLMKDIVAMVNYPMKVINHQKVFRPETSKPPRIISTTPRPVEVSFPTQPSIFSKPPPVLIQTATPPSVRNPFERITQGPPKNLFEPSTEQPHTEQPQIYNTPPFPNVEQFRPNLISPPTSIAPEITPASTPEYSPTLNNFDPSKIYISNLGELSTDPESNFDPKTAVILPDKSQEQSPIFAQAGNQEHLLEGKIEPPQSDANKNYLLNFENIASSIPGNINSELALVRDQPIVEGGFVQLPGTLHVSLNYTQRINTALRNVLIPSAAQEQIAVNPLLSGDGKLISEIYGHNKLQDTNGILKFAHNINSAFQVNNPALGLSSQEAKRLLNSGDQQSTGFGGFSGTDRGVGFSTISSPYGPDGKPKTQSFTTASVQPTSVQGFGFTKSNFAVSTPASILHTQTIYIPSINLKPNPTSEKTTDVTATNEPHLLLDQIPDTIQNILGNDHLDQDHDQLTAAAQHYGSDLQRLRQNELGDSKNHAKRAESLLLKGVQLSLYDATKTDSLIDDGNRIDVTDDAPLQSTEKTISTTMAQTFLVREQDIDDSIGLEQISTTTEDVSRSLPLPTVSHESSSSPTQLPSTPTPVSLPTFSIAFETTQPTQLVDSHSNGNAISEPDIAKAISTTPESSIMEEISTIPTESFTTISPQKKSVQPKNQFFTRARKTKPAVTTTDTTLITTEVDRTDPPSDITQSTNTYEIRAALSKSRKNVKKALGTPVTSSGGAALFKRTRITNRGRRLHSTTHIIQNQSSQPNGSRGSLKSNSPYVNLPGTKVSIAKSIEEGFFSVSNYPLLPNTNQPMSFSSIFPGVILHPGTPFKLRRTSEIDSNFLFPFSTISPIKTPDESTVVSTTTKPSSVSLMNSNKAIIATTPIPSLTSIPLSSHTAQRRSDSFNSDNDEDSFFKGVSSYHVPLSSVGRLPADIQGTKKR